jgi:hypothetical protein
MDLSYFYLFILHADLLFENSLGQF